jgi:outer membrane protein
MRTTARIDRATPLHCAVASLPVILLLVGAPAASFAQTPPTASAAPETPQRISMQTISLADAVKLTVANDPQIKLAQQNVASSSGQYLQARGAFDWTIALTPGLTYSNVALAPSVRNDEKNRRLKLQAVAVAFGMVNRTLLDSLASLGPRPPRCPVTFASSSDVILRGADPLSLTFPNMKGFENTHFSFEGSIRDTLYQFQVNSICAPPDRVAANNGIIAELWQTLPPQLTGTGLNETVVLLTQAPHELLALNQQITQAVSSRAKLALDRIGVVPLDEVATTGKFDGSLSRAFRNGVSAGVNLHLQSFADNFKDKSLDPNYGGKGYPIRFDSSVYANFTIPLMRGRGAVAAAAPERAANLTVSAATDQLRFATTEETFRTVLAYLTMIGAQENVRSLEESVARQNRITQLTQQLVSAGEIPAMEMRRTQARAAAVAAALTQARGAIVDARMSLAEAMGVDVETLANAPLAAETFANSLAGVPDVDSLVAAAMSSRFDVRALASLHNAAQVLHSGAVVNQRMRLDLSIKAGMATFYEDPLFYFLPDELNPIYTQLAQEAPPQPIGDPVRFSTATGYYRGMFERPWEPVAAFTFNVELPWGNNSLRGRTAQAEVSLERARVQQQDLVRVIRENIINEVGTLRLSAEAIRRDQAAVEASQQTLEAALSRFQQGDVTLIDTLLTEEALTQDRLTLVNEWQNYLSQLARLKFETGTLVFVSGPTMAPEQIRFDSTDLVRQ